MMPPRSLRSLPPRGPQRPSGGRAGVAMADVMFTNVRVFDGGGEAPFTGDVLVQGNRISRVTKTATACAPCRSSVRR